MRTDMRAQVESLLEEYRALTTRLDRMQADLTTLAATGRAVDGSVTATVRPHGELVHLSIDEAAARRLDSAALAARVVEAVGLATTRARRSVGAVVSDLLPGRLGGMVRPDGTVDASRLLPMDPLDLGPLRGDR